MKTGLGRRHSMAAVGEFGVAISGGVWVAISENPASAKRPMHQQAVMDQVAHGLGLDDEGALDLADLKNRYRSGLSFLLRETSAYELIISRYLLNELLREAFPWGQTPAMLHYRRLLTRFGIRRLIPSGVASSTENMLDQDTIVRTVQVYCRLYQHNDAFAKNAELCLKDLDWNSLERLYTLLK